MDCLRRFIIVLVLMGLVSELLGQDANVLDCRFKQLFVANDMVSWALLVDSLEQNHLSNHEDEILLYAEYGLIAHLIGEDKDDDAELRLARFDIHVDRLLQHSQNDPNLHTMKAAVLGFKMGISPWRATYLAVSHQSKINAALEMSSQHVMPLMEKAHLLYFMPSFIGGDRLKAIEMYEEALLIIDRQGKCNWMYFHIGAWLGQVYQKMDKKEKAEDIYRHLLKMEPEFKQVKDELLPGLMKGDNKNAGDQFEKILR